MNSLHTAIFMPSKLVSSKTSVKSGLSQSRVVHSVSSYFAIEFKASAIPLTSLANGPIWSRLMDKSSKPCLETAPYVGLNPTTPQWDAGFLMDPPVSEPIEMSHISAAIAAAQPPEEPPGILPIAAGFWVGP